MASNLKPKSDGLPIQKLFDAFLIDRLETKGAGAHARAPHCVPGHVLEPVSVVIVPVFCLFSGI